MRYPLKIAFKSLWVEKWINLLSIVSISVGLFILGFMGSVLYNVESLTADAPERFVVTVFIKRDVSETETKRLVSLLKSNPLVKSVEFISKQQALQELKESLKGSDYILEGLKDNPLFASVVIKLKRSAFDRGEVKSFIETLRRDKRIDEVIYGEELLNTIVQLYKGIKLLGVVIGSLFCIAIVFICYSTIKMLFYRRKEEVEVYKLLGATRGFIRSPFLLEGLLLGMLGGVLAGGSNILIFNLLGQLGNPVVPLMRHVSLPLSIPIGLPIIGMILGVVGATIALGRIRY